MTATDIEKKLDTAIKNIGKDVINMSEVELKNWAGTLSKDQIGLLLNRFRGTRDFYKHIGQEEYRKKKPNAWRYQDADDKLSRYNSHGKILKQIFDSKQ
jgi:hypothetical protein